MRAGTVTVATDRGAHALREALDALDAVDVGVRDAALAPPSLDDVFLSLTGSSRQRPEPPATVEPAASNAAPARGGDGARKTGTGTGRGFRQPFRARRKGAHAWRP